MFTLLCLAIFAASPLSAAVVKDTIDPCSPTEYSCGDGGCISVELVCDGSRDCADGGDEVACERGSMTLASDGLVLHRARRQSPKCRKDQWQCRDGSCIPFDGKCDGTFDCTDRSDESHALCRKSRCQHNWFRCTYGACVDGTAACNGIQECADNSDELLPKCRNETDEVRGQFKCKDGTTIPATNHCDGVKDCADGSDETLETCAGKTCPSYLFQCAYGACVDGGSDCNQVTDCADGSDEAAELCNRNLPTPTVKPPQGNCVLPAQPAHGKYVANVPNAKPGDTSAYFYLNITCRQGYGVDTTKEVYCYDGTWFPKQMPKCIRLCHLSPHPSVEYRCIVSGTVEGSRDCKEYEPAGTIVSPRCRTPNYYSATALRFMRCINGIWDYVATCSPGLTKNGTNITILVKNKVEVHVSDFQYTVPYAQAPGPINGYNSSQFNPVVPSSDGYYNNERPVDYIVPITNTPINYSDNSGSNYESFTNKYGNTESNSIDDAKKETNAKDDEVNYEISDLDWRKGGYNSNENTNTYSNPVKDNGGKKAYTTDNNRTNVYFNISNSSVYVYADGRIVFGN